MKKLMCLCASLAFAASAAAGDLVLDQVKGTPVGDVSYRPGDFVDVNCITWGGESALFVANGMSRETTPDSIFGKLGIKIRLNVQDDPIKALKDYRSGKTPLWRGTLRMAGAVSEVFAADPRTNARPVVQMTWSLGDHIVARQHVKTLSDLKGTTGCFLPMGPHEGLVHDSLSAAQLGWKDVKIVDAPVLAGPGGPADVLRNNPNVDWVAVITPDMLDLTGGLQSIGSGAEKTVEGAHVLVSTSELSRSIADMFFVRGDFDDAHGDFVEKFRAGYLKGCEEVIAWKKAYESRGSADYMKLLQFVQDMFGTEAIPDLENYAHGLISDCQFVGPGNEEFFKNQKDPVSFAMMSKSATDLAVARGYASKVFPLSAGSFDLAAVAAVGSLKNTDTTRTQRFRGEALQEEFENFADGGSGKVIYSFTVQFNPDSAEFPIKGNEKHFKKAQTLLRQFGNAAMAMRAHADPSLTLIDLVKAGMAKGIIKRSGSRGNWSYTLNGRPLDLTSTDDVIRLIELGKFDGHAQHDPRETMTAALNISNSRANNARNSFIEHSRQNDLILDASQVTAVGVGIREPFIPKPRDYAEAEKNMRVEFAVIRVKGEVRKDTDFDF